MIVGSRPDGGHAVVLQADHAVMTGELAAAWGAEAFGGPPLEAVVTAAAGHELGWAERDRPRLDRATGLPYTARDLPLAEHLPMQLEGPRRLGEREPLAGLLAAVKHARRYERPATLALVRRRHRLVRRFLADSARLQDELRRRAGAPEAAVERGWRVVDTCDRMSHALLVGRDPLVLRGVPAAGSARADLTLRSGGPGTHVVAPWPFAGDRLRLEVPARVLRGTCADQAALDAAFAAAPVEGLVFDLRPPSGPARTLPG